MPEKITLFALTVAAISVTKQLVCDNHHQVSFSHLLLVHRTKWQHLRLLCLPVALPTKELRIYDDRTSLTRLCLRGCVLVGRCALRNIAAHCFLVDWWPKRWG
jgi:hypothetical protein